MADDFDPNIKDGETHQQYIARVEARLMEVHAQHAASQESLQESTDDLKLSLIMFIPVYGAVWLIEAKRRGHYNNYGWIRTAIYVYFNISSVYLVPALMDMFSR